jgi:tetratricopeptide (TPR) repeat protein
LSRLVRRNLFSRSIAPALLAAGLWFAALDGALFANVVDLSFSHDGRYIASLTDDGSLFVHETETFAEILRVEHIVRGDRIAWRPGVHQIAVALDEGEGWDIWLLDLDGQRRRVTKHPAQESQPCWTRQGRRLVYVSFQNGDADLYCHEMDTDFARPFVVAPYDQWAPTPQPYGQGLAYLSMNHSELQVWLTIPEQEPFRLDNMDPLNQFPVAPKIGWDGRGDYLLYTREGLGATELMLRAPNMRESQLALKEDRIVDFLMNSQRAWLVTGSGRNLLYHKLSDQPGKTQGPPVDLLASGLPLSRPAVSPFPDNAGFAAIAQQRYIAVSSSPQGPWRFLVFNLDDSLFHAERLRAANQWETAEAVYANLLARETRADERARIRLHQAVQLRRLGRHMEAIQIISTLASPPNSLVDAARVESLRGNVAFFELRDYEKARASFQNADRLAGASRDGRARERLEVLETPDSRFFNLYADAHSALRRGAIPESIEAMRSLVSRGGGQPLVVQAVLEILANPYADESHSRLDNPFERIANIDAVADLLLALDREIRKIEDESKPKSAESESESESETNSEAVTEAGAVAEKSDSVYERFYEELLQSLVQTRRFDLAQTVALRRLETVGAQKMGVSDFLLYYIESDRVDVYVQNLLGRVLLTDRIVPILERQLMGDARAQARLSLARVKMALLEGDLDAAQARMLATVGLFKSFSKKEYSIEVARLQAYLHMYAAKRHERYGDWDSATASYRAALSALENFAPDNIAMSIQIRLALGALSHAAVHGPVIWQTQLVLRGMGDTALNPTNDPVQLRMGVRNLMEIFRGSTPSSLDSLLLLHIGYGLSRAELPHQAAHFLDRALASEPSAELRAAILWEKATLAENTQNWWMQHDALRELWNYAAKPAQLETLQLLTAKPLLKLGKYNEARDILRPLARNAILRPQREEATQLLDLIDTQWDQQISRTPIPLEK